MTIPDLYKIYQQYPSVQTDTRKLKKGDIFFALKGDNFNGNRFAKQALDAGASYVVIDDAKYAINDQTLVVEDVLTTLQLLARHHREQFLSLSGNRNIPFIAITGSNGKTTTKELIHAVLSSHFKTYTTEGNLNNHIGIPLTILKIGLDAEMVVIEMGANHLNEIKGYCEYAQPTHGLITNVGKAHLEGFGSAENVFKGKGELFDFLRGQVHGFAFVMWDYEYLHEMSKGISGIIKYGTVSDAHIIGHALKSEPYLEVTVEQGMEERLVKTNLVGEYNLPNVLAAITIGKTMEVPEHKIVAALNNYLPGNSRSQLVHRGSNTIVLDAYNANPSSMKLAIENFAKMRSSDKVLLLGAMAELGADSSKEHQEVIDLINKHKWKAVALVGGDFLKLDHGFNSFTNSNELKKWLQIQNYEDSILLIKGSRSMQMEKAIDD